MTDAAYYRDLATVLRGSMSGCTCGSGSWQWIAQLLEETEVRLDLAADTAQSPKILPEVAIKR